MEKPGLIKRVINRLFSRPVVIGCFILVQLGVLYGAIVLLGQRVSFFYAFCRLVALVLVLQIIYRRNNPSYKIAWIIPIMAMPLFGGLLYLVFGKTRLSHREIEKMRSIARDFGTAMAGVEDVLPAIEQQDPDGAMMSRYIRRAAGAPAFGGTETTSLPLGEVFFEHLMAELRRAEKFIFMEFYIIRPGKMWDEVHALLRQKAAEGVEVRLLYDDWGCMFKLPEGTDKQLEKEGIRTCVFNPFRAELSIRFNNRDHRKIVVVDGEVAFTGGINISDEYINAAERCGHWLDCGILLRGEAVWGFTAMFLSMWDLVRGETTVFDHYRPTLVLPEAEGGWVQPFTDTPLDEEPVGATVYKNIIQRAQKYVYINSPYLIIDDEMISALTTAAKCGVDVRLVTPAVCDSRLVQEMSRSYYEELVNAGVKVYEYTPGMVHAKTFVSDDRWAVVGSINLDYRSLYLHHECAVWMSGTQSVMDMKAAFEEELTHCQPFTAEMCREQSRYRHVLWAVLRALAPLF